MSARMLPARMRALPARKSALLCALDIGTAKIVCLIARLDPMDASECLRGRTHRCRLLGIGHQRSAGIKSGVVVDLDEAENAIRRAVDAAERMAGVQVESVILNVTGGRIGSQLYNAQVGIGSRGVNEADIHLVLEACAARTQQQGKAVLHSLPTGFSLGDMRNIRDPKGMIGDMLGADMHIVSCDATVAHNLMLAVERCHLSVEAIVATPYAAALAALVDDEAELGTTLIDMGAGTTSIGVFAGGKLVHVDALALGGGHVTLDIARGLNTRLADAERLKTLYGACLGSSSDERETVAVTLAGDDGDRPTHVPKVATLADHKAAGRGDPRTPARPSAKRRAGGKFRVAFHSYRRRQSAHRDGRDGQTDPCRPDSAGPPARHPCPAGSGQKSKFFGGCRPPRLSAGGQNRIFSARTAPGRSGNRNKRLYRPRRAMVERKLLVV